MFLLDIKTIDAYLTENHLFHLNRVMRIISIRFFKDYQLMPYYLYKIFPAKNAEIINEHAEYRSAKTAAKELRAELPSDVDYKVKMIFAKDPPQAEHLLAQKREPRQLGEDA